MNRRLIFGCICFFTLLLTAKGQFSDSVTHHLRYAASGNINRTNTTTAYLITNDARFRVRNKKTTLNTGASWVYGELGEKLTNNDFTGTVDFNLFLHGPDFYYWGLANYTISLSLRVNSQLQSGLGVAYNFVDTTNAWLNLSTGLLYETSSLRTAASGKDAYQTIRNSLRLSYRFVAGELFIFSGTNFLQNSLRDGNDYIIRTTNSLQLKLNKWISFGTTLTYNQVRRTGSENLLFSYGLTAEKYF